jgi:hypothetical protein
MEPEVWKVMVKAYSKVLMQQSHGETEENQPVIQNLSRNPLNVSQKENKMRNHCMIIWLV